MAFPNLKGKHLKDSMCSPEEFLQYKKAAWGYKGFTVPKGVIFCYSRRLLRHILEKNKARKVEGLSGEFYLLEDVNSEVGVAANFGIGSPAAAALMEELIALGVERFVSVGEAGTLQKSLKIGSIVVCEKAIRDEGTSHHYLKPAKYAYASKEMTRKIEKVLQKLGRKYVTGSSWTIDAPYRETAAEVKKYQKENVSTVEMEAAALFAVAEYRKVEAGAIFTVSDSLAELFWEPKFHVSSMNWDVIFRAAVEALLDS